ncbi:hypothetical protein GCM10010193_09900 [Kitasatospora atroaurantiaca]|uniref:Uncharacterized protein n=1 Tax=Kitasatospora atroaurantiaca TaxID=285545 RepID=A0A561ES47_9ACTN|nr:hypothetical protein FB465_3513 [Kitasatospora atroaurantiaca]
MEEAGQWSVVWEGATAIALSFILSLGTRWWRQRRPSTMVRQRRSHLEWLPFMFGAVVVVAALPRTLGASASTVSLADTLAHVLALTTVFMALRAAVILLARCIRLLLGRGTADSHG